MSVLLNFQKPKIWLSKLFGRSPLKWIRGRKRGWSDEEKSLLVGLLPISREDQELIQWGYSLSRDSEGWTLINHKRITKPKQSLLALLREFSSELDKWRSARTNAGAKGDLKPESDGWTPARKQAGYEEFGETVTFPPRFDQLPVEYQHRIDARIEALTPEQIAAVREIYGPDAPIPEKWRHLSPSVQAEIKAWIANQSAKETAA